MHTDAVKVSDLATSRRSSARERISRGGTGQKAVVILWFVDP